MEKNSRSGDRFEYAVVNRVYELASHLGVLIEDYELRSQPKGRFRLAITFSFDEQQPELPFNELDETK